MHEAHFKVLKIPASLRKKLHRWVAVTAIRDCKLRLFHQTMADLNGNSATPDMIDVVCLGFTIDIKKV